MKDRVLNLMKGCGLNLLILIFFIGCLNGEAFAQEKQRKKVGVVLSGGGALGVAHVGALKVLEEAGIPIDYIVGTSMGSIIGGMYAYGYTTTQLDSILRAQDWMSLLLNSTDRSNQNFIDRELEERYMFTVPLLRDKSKHLYGGVLSGERVLNMFYALFPAHTDSMDFRNLDIPFACVAVDLLTNKEIHLYEGVLPECVRASMSIPGVFSPLRKDGMILVDGGFLNNYPVDLVKQMGADIVIGVTLDAEVGEKTAEDVPNTAGVVLQIVSNIINNDKLKHNKEMTDLIINVNTIGYTPGSFTTPAINELIDKGEAAARKAYQDILDIRKEIGLTDEDTCVVARDAVQVPEESKLVNGTALPYEKGLEVSGGFRADNEELAAVLLGANYQFDTRFLPCIGAEIRLGKRSYGQLTGWMEVSDDWTLEGTYRFAYNETKLYRKGNRVLDWDYHEHLARLSFFRSVNYMMLGFGANFYWRRFDNLLTPMKVTSLDFLPSVGYDEERNLDYFALASFDNRDMRIYSHSGLYWLLRYSFKTDDGAHFEDKTGLSILEAYVEQNCPLSERLTLVPAVWGRMMSTSDFDRLGDRNVIGGVGTHSHYLPQQMPFAGINRFEVVDDKFAALGATLRYRIGKKHHVSAIGNYGRSSRHLDDFFSENELVGCALGYGYKTPIGPLDFNFNWSNWTEKIGFWLNLGYMF